MTDEGDWRDVDFMEAIRAAVDAIAKRPEWEQEFVRENQRRWRDREAYMAAFDEYPLR